MSAPEQLLLLFAWFIIWFMIIKYPSQGAALWGLAIGLATIGFFVECPISIILWVIAGVSFLLGAYFLFVLKYDPNLPPGHGATLWPEGHLKKRKWWQRH